MKYPKFLSEKGTIGLVAPSFGICGFPYKERYDEAINQLSKREHQFKYVDHIYDFIHSASISAKELTEFYISDENEFLLSVAGGELMVEINSELDFEVFKTATPKWFMGYSDNTNFAFQLTTICDVASIYGIHITDFGSTNWDHAINDSYDLIRGKKLSFSAYPMCQIVDMKYERPLDGYVYDTESKWLNLVGGENIEMHGRIIGGCLDCLDNICGTPYDHMQEFANRYQEDGIIFYFEACDLNPMSLRRVLWRLKECGWFKNINGFVVGRPNNPSPAFDYSHQDIVEDMLKEYNVPIIFNFDVGHVPPSIPIINGAIAHIISNNDEQSITYELV